MQPTKSSVTDLFETRVQYVIPLFQRGYVWTLEEELLPLWRDLMAQVEATNDYREAQAKIGNQGQVKAPRKHFLGTVVLGPIQEEGNGRVGSREVIDGQQRITTFHLLYLAFRDLLKDLGQEVCREELGPLTRNPGTFQDKTDHHKVNPTNVGRDIMRGLVDQGGLEEVCARYPVQSAGRRVERPPMVQAYLFFYGAISFYLRGIALDEPPTGQGPDGKDLAHQLVSAIHRDPVPPVRMQHRPINEDLAHRLLAVLRSGFQLMVLKLDDQEDDPQIIFETLNARGVPLQPSDLIRNYLFLQAARKKLEVDELYDRYWKPYDETPDDTASSKGLKFWKVEEKQGRLKNSRLDLFLYHYLRLRRQEEVKVTHVFEEFKAWWESEDRNMAEELARLLKASELFRNFLAPNQTSRLGIFCRRIKMLETATLAPLVLYFLEHHPADSPAVAAVLKDLESYLVRRFVCGLTPKGYNQLFTRLLRRLVDLNSTDPATLRALLQELDTNSYLWPGDEDFRRGWLTRPVYVKGGVKARAILEGLEGSMGSGKQEWRDLPDALSVEHVMPQAWEANWPLADQTDEGVALRESLLHTIGNLTLVMGAFNASLSNAGFEVKRQEITTNSLLRLNTYFQAFAASDAAWDEAAIRMRAEALFPAALALWPHPGPLQGKSLFKVSEEGAEDMPLLLGQKARRTPKAAAGLLGEWNGEYFACFGDEDRRLWSEARKFGFISAGGGPWYTRTLKSLRRGDRVWVHVPNRGYVAMGIVEAPVVKIDAFRVQLPDGRELPLSDPSLGIQAQGMFDRQEDPEAAEYLVKVRWARDLPLEEAIWEPGFFASQHSVCRPRVEAWNQTVGRLKELWAVD